MPLSAGTRLGPYEILAPLGAGGMGEVYRAHDSRLNRDVAIKTLPSAFANDAERMARFQREAQVLAALNHPHIAGIYGIEQSAIVMELVEGRNLAGPVPIDEAIAIARQIADALDAAHQKNIIHRDLKPANVKITPEGNVKVLDFGLAKAFDANSAGSDPANSPTRTMNSTVAGVIMGTAGYMSPEQARGKAVDKRADIWAFGVVLYELLTGERAFDGETVSDTLAAVLRADPDWKRLPAETPVGVRRLLQRCLERDPNKRLRDIGDVWNDMQQEPAAPPRQTKVNWLLGALATLAVIAAGAATWEWMHGPVPEPRAVTRSAVSLARPYWGVALSRDGSRLAYVDDSDHLSLRMMDQLEGKAIPGGEHAYSSPEFSPDGQWIAYISNSPPKLKKIPVGGGASITLCEVTDLQEPRLNWALDDTILFGSPKGLMKVPAAGGTPQPLSTVDTKNGDSGHYSPQLLPGGRTMLFTIAAGSLIIGGSGESARIALLDLKTGATRVLIKGAYDGLYVPSGHLVYLREGTLFAAAFDTNRLAMTGPEAPVVEGIYRLNYTFSDSSLLVFESNGAMEAPSTLEWTDRQGVAQPLSEPPHRWASIEVSPDGKLFVGSIIDDSGRDKADVWKYDLERRTLTRLTFGGLNGLAIWTPDGRSVTYTSVSNGKSSIYRLAVDQSSPPELLVTSDTFAYPQSWTPDGKTLLYDRTLGGKYRLWILPAPGEGKESQPRLFSQVPFNEHGTFSPDGKWLAYDSDKSGKYEIYVVPFPGPGEESQISSEGGSSPAWSRSGRELYYVKPGSEELMAVDIAAGPAFRAGRPQALFKLSGRSAFGASFYVTPDPKRFLVRRAADQASAASLVTITDWFDDLRRRAPVKK